MGDPFQPEWGKIRKNKTSRSYSNYLAKALGRGGLDAEQAYRQQAYGTIANQTMAARDAARTGVAGAFGANNPSGLTAALQSRAQLAAPYAQAGMQATMAGQNQQMRLGQGWQDARQRNANFYTTLMGPYLQNKQIEQAAALAAAQAGGAGGDGGLWSGLGQLAGAAASSYASNAV